MAVDSKFLKGIFFKKHFFFRRESWGGFVINMKSGEKFELDLPTAFLFESIEQRKYIPETNIEVTELLATSFFELNDCPTTKLSTISLKEPVQKKALLNALDIPLNVTIYPSFDCNQKCSFCFVNSKKRCLSMLPLERWKELVKEVYDLRIPYLSLLGGEPLLYRSNMELINFANSIGQKIHVTTNGNHLDPLLPGELAKIEKLDITVSLHGSDTSHNDITRGSSQTTKQFIKRLIQHGKIPTIHMVALEETLLGALQLIDFADANGIGTISIGAYQPASDKKLKMISLYKLDEAVVRLQEYVRSKNYRVEIRLEACLRYSTQESTVLPTTFLSNMTSGCPAGKTSLEILSDGSVIPCVRFDTERGYCGSIVTHSLIEIWKNSILLHKLRARTSNDSQCLACPYATFCKGGCPAVTLDTQRRDPQCVR
ncbi:MAG: radical SAM protein [Oligoflexia bacterium]|nr:radical SAM protein [Oligoflexia bacterium]